MMPNMPTGETMSEGSAMPPMPSPTSSLEQCVPIEALGQPDDQDQVNPPEVGDVVDYNVTGRVTRIEGRMAYVTPETVNGKEVGAADGQEPGGDTLESLESAAKGMDSL